MCKQLDFNHAFQSLWVASVALLLYVYRTVSKSVLALFELRLFHVNHSI